MVSHEREEAEQNRTAEEARIAARQQQLGRGLLDEMLALCREGWRENLGLYQEPVALAWTRQGVDGYFFDGADGNSLRQVRCDAVGVSRGPRVAHPLHALLPAEAPIATDDADESWRLALGATSRTFAEGELAFELLRHPLTGQVLSRQWRAAPEGAVARLLPTDAPVFPLLPAAPGFQPASPLPGLAPLRRRDWTVEADAAFDLLARELPRNALVSEITLTPDEIEVQITHPTAAFDGKPPAPFGEREFDEYGVADSSWWYPREIPGFGCAIGRPLDVVRADFVQRRAQRGPQLLRAWYSCSPAYSNKHDGAWHMVTPND